MLRADSEDLRVVASLPKSWEVERSFNDVLYEWMASAPWLAISGAVHGVIVLVMLMIPWEMFEPPKARIIVSDIVQEPEDPFEDPPPPEEPDELEREPTEEPVLKDAEISDHNETEDDQQTDRSLGEVDENSEAPFEGQGDNPVIGIGPSGGGRHGDRVGGRQNLTTRGGGGTEKPLQDSLAWLAAHQSGDGSWDCDGFTANCGRIQAGSACDGPGEATHDVGVTGLALLAFLGDGNTTRGGRYQEEVARAIKWLKDQQDQDTGIFGEKIGHSWMYDHSIATLAMCEAYYFSKNPLLKRSAQDAINLITQARNPYGAWRYNCPPTGENDTSVTGWCVFALASAKDGGLTIDPEGFVGAAQWLDEVTDPTSGRAGYDAPGSASSRVPGLNDQYPTDQGEAMTAVAILSRVFMGQDVAKLPIVDKGADLLRARLPEWDPAGLGNDMYYWYYGSYAMFQLGGARWDAWNKAAKKALLDSQRMDGDAKGSWDPKDAWGHSGGRVYMTALGALCLEVYFRYSRVLGGR